MPTTSRRNDQGCSAPLLSVSALSFALLASRAFAGVGAWTTNGPATGIQTAVVLDPAGTLYAGGPASAPLGPMARSNDGGMSWHSLSLLGIPLAAGPAGTVYAQTVANSGGSAFTSTLYSSNDRGISWTSLIQGPQTLFTLTVDPFLPSTLYRVDLLMTATEPQALSGKVWRSTDQGASWIEIDGDLNLGSRYYINAFVPDPKSAGVFYAAVADSVVDFLVGTSERIFKTSDGGEHWQPVGYIGGTVTVLAVDPFSTTTLYAGFAFSHEGTAVAGLLRSLDGGGSFQQVSYQFVDAIAMDPSRPNHLYFGGGGMWTSTDGGATSISAGLPSGIGVYALAIDHSGQFLHAATGQSGVYDYQLSASLCTQDSQTLCLNNGRFSVTATFQAAPAGPSAPATAIPLTSDTGYFWFFDPANVEVVTKVLDGCSTNGNYWFFASGLTNVGAQITVKDGLTGGMRSYTNTVGTAFQPAQDTAAFPCP